MPKKGGGGRVLFVDIAGDETRVWKMVDELEEWPRRGMARSPSRSEGVQYDSDLASTA